MMIRLLLHPFKWSGSNWVSGYWVLRSLLSIFTEQILTNQAFLYWKTSFASLRMKDDSDLVHGSILFSETWMSGLKLDVKGRINVRFGLFSTSGLIYSRLNKCSHLCLQTNLHKYKIVLSRTPRHIRRAHSSVIGWGGVRCGKSCYHRHNCGAFLITARSAHLLSLSLSPAFIVSPLLTDLGGARKQWVTTSLSRQPSKTTLIRSTPASFGTTRGRITRAPT